MNKLKSCQCGGEATFAAVSISGGNQSIFIKCKECGIKSASQLMPTGDAFLKVVKKKLADKWNTRADVSIGMSREDAEGMIDDLANIIDEDGHSAINVFQVQRVLSEIYDSIESKNVVTIIEAECRKDNQ